MTGFLNRLENLEYGLKDLRFDYEFHDNSGFKLEELRDELETMKKEEEFFLKLKIISGQERDKLQLAEREMINKMEIVLDEENYEKLKEDPDYRRTIKELEAYHRSYDIGEKYWRQLKQQQKKIIKKIHDLETREAEFEN